MEIPRYGDAALPLLGEDGEPEIVAAEDATARLVRRDVAILFDLVGPLANSVPRSGAISLFTHKASIPVVTNLIVSLPPSPALVIKIKDFVRNSRSVGGVLAPLSDLVIKE
jgi:hypothetical protein